MSDSLDKVQLKLKLMFLLESNIRDIFVTKKNFTAEELLELVYLSLYDSYHIVLDLWQISARQSTEEAYSRAMRRRYDSESSKSTPKVLKVQDAVDYVVHMYFLSAAINNSMVEIRDFIDLHKLICSEVQKSLGYGASELYNILKEEINGRQY